MHFSYDKPVSQTPMAESKIEFLLDIDPRLLRRVVHGDFQRLSQVRGIHDPKE
jgi:hypothetical protein